MGKHSELDLNEMRTLLEEETAAVGRNIGDLLNGQFISALDLFNMEIPAPEWVVPDILPEGTTVLAGKPKAGKSWLALGLGIAKAGGGHFLGKVKLEPTRVLYLALEDTPGRLKDRMHSMLQGEAPPAKLILSTRWPKMDQGGDKQLEAYLNQYPDTKLVIIDTLQKVRPRSKGNGNIYGEDYTATEAIKGISDRYKIAILVIHHVRKMDSEDIFETISGSTGLTGGVDNVMVIKKDRSRADAVLHITGRDVADAELALKWDPVLTQWEMLGDAQQYRISEERQHIIELLESANGERMSAKEIAEALGRKYNSIRCLLLPMHRDNQISKDAHGFYFIPITHITPITEAEKPW